MLKDHLIPRRTVGQEAFRVSKSKIPRFREILHILASGTETVGYRGSIKEGSL